MSKLILVGAGPGDPELISVKAVKALQKADVVLYDALANEDLLEYCNGSCECVFVGKKPGIHHYQQIYINEMIVDYGRRVETVVRLKGGDPFIFGRGYEELEHAEGSGMHVEVIPGISSSAAVPTYSKIPLTHRGCTESFWVVTGTTSSLELSKDMSLAAQSSATAVILMGMRNLDRIVELFSGSRGLNEPIGIIQNGTHKSERSVFGTLNTIVDQVRISKIASPAIIVIGDVVKLGRSELYSRLESMNYDLEEASFFQK